MKSIPRAFALIIPILAMVLSAHTAVIHPAAPEAFRLFAVLTADAARADEAIKNGIADQADGGRNVTTDAAARLEDERPREAAAANDGAAQVADTGKPDTENTLPADRKKLVEQIDRSLERGVRYLTDHQSRDGAWRSETYGCFKEGPELTPYVLSCVYFIPQGGDKTKSSYEKGVGYLLSLVNEDGTLNTGPQGFMFPVHTSAMASRVVVLASKDPAHLRAQAAYLKYLRARRLSGDLGWSPEDREFGGWGFSLSIPRKPEKADERPMFCESNLSATIFGVAALRSAKVPDSDPIYGEILAFVKKCQNYSDGPVGADGAFDDGGFIFIPDDDIQNKAGIAGTDRLGRKRYHSYGSMTADGLRALLRCGLPKDDGRVKAALKWLEWNFSTSMNPGIFNKDREELRNSYYYYYLWAVAHAFQAMDKKEIMTKYGKVFWPEALSREILSRQRDDGTWINRYTDAKEDDPLVSVPWAVSTLAICRQMMTGEDRTLFPRVPYPGETKQPYH
jgi:squalene-hopene/tetraprenyl-beta-curcumene cyclase